MERVGNGSLTVIGRVGEVQPSHLMLPITIEPNKPRMWHDETFFNLWIKDCPFTLDYITDLPRYVDQNHYQTAFDNKSATLPFGWKARVYISHMVVMAATHFTVLSIY